MDFLNTEFEIFNFFIILAYEDYLIKDYIHNFFLILVFFLK